MGSQLRDPAGGEKPEARGFRGWIAGRANRREYWLLTCPLVALILAVGALSVPLAYLACVAVLLVWIRRLHDCGSTGWLGAAIALVMIVYGVGAGVLFGDRIAAGVGGVLGLVAMIVLGVLPGEARDNEYGPMGPRRARRNLALHRRPVRA